MAYLIWISLCNAFPEPAVRCAPLERARQITGSHGAVYAGCHPLTAGIHSRQSAGSGGLLLSAVFCPHSQHQAGRSWHVPRRQSAARIQTQIFLLLNMLRNEAKIARVDSALVFSAGICFFISLCLEDILLALYEAHALQHHH